MRITFISFVLTCILSSQAAFAQSGAIDIDAEFKRAHKTCLAFLDASNDQDILNLQRNGYRVKKRGRGLSAYLESSRAIPASRRPSIEVFTGKKAPLKAQKTCQIFIGGVTFAQNEVLHSLGMVTLLTSGFRPAGKPKGKIAQFSKGNTKLWVSGVVDRGLYKLILSRLK